MGGNANIYSTEAQEALKTMLQEDGSIIVADGIEDTIIGAVTPAAGTFTTLISDTLNTGQGANELYDMDQNVQISDSPTFATTDLTDITDGNIPYMATSAAGFVDSPVSTDGTDITLTNKVNSKNTSEYGTLIIKAGDMIPCDTNGATFGNYEYSTNDVSKDYVAFDNTTEEYRQYSCVMPEDWDRGTIKAKFYWSSATGSTAGDKVEWELAAMATGDGDTLDIAFANSQVIYDTLLSNNGVQMQISSATPALTVQGTPVLGDDIQFRISRNRGSANDDMTEDSWLFKIVIQYTKNNTIAAW